MFNEFVQFGAEPNKYLDVMDLNVVSQGDCWALAEVWILLSAFLVVIMNFCLLESRMTQKLQIWSNKEPIKFCHREVVDPGSIFDIFFQIEITFFTKWNN